MLGTTSKPLLSADYKQVTTDLNESAPMNAIVCNASLRYRGRDSIGCILVIILYKSGVAECLCHFAGKLPLCNNSVAICERAFCSKSIKFWLNSSAWIAQMSTLFWSCCSLQTLALLVLDKHNKKFTVKDHHPQLAVSKL